MNWGDVPTWGAATFTGVAAFFAYRAYGSQKVQLKEQRQFITEQSTNLQLERAELRAVAKERRWTQARQVIMQHRKTGDEQVGSWRVSVHNTSGAPVHEVQVRFGSAYVASAVYEWGDVPPWSPRLFGERLVTPVHLLGSGRSAIFLSQEWPAATAHNNRPIVYFKDDSGVRWSLDTYGKLSEEP